MVSIKEILKITEKKIIEDDTIICYGNSVLEDCNKFVCKESIALRELMIYGDFPESFKQNVFRLLNIYGRCLDHDYDNFFEGLNILNNISPLNDRDWIEAGKFLLYPMCYEESSILEIGIQEILLTNWQDYNIPTNKYDDIILSHKNIEIDACTRLKHHYKALYNNNIDWNIKEKNYKYEIDITYKDLKTIALQARDSGGHLDCFGYAHDGTTNNCIRMFLSKKFNIPYECGYDINDEELESLANDILQYLPLGEFYIEIY